MGNPRIPGESAGFARIFHATHNDPFGFLGPHAVDGGVIVRAFLPDAERAFVVAPDGAPLAAMESCGKGGFTALLPAPAGTETPYRLRLSAGEDTWEIDDPYRFPAVLGDLDRHLMAEGRHRRLFDKLGAHPAVVEGIAGVTFAVWAPNARRVSVVGDFNAWDGRRHPMRLHPGCGVWEIFLPGVTEGAVYKFELLGPNGKLLPLKADPLAFACETPPHTASRVIRRGVYAWGDAAWMARRKDANAFDAPMAIYEAHLGSWQRCPEEGNRYLTYREMAERLVPYVRDLGFTHIELLPVNEYPFDGSWGYQPIGLFAPTSRFGGPDDFRAFVDACHAAGIGVILDWVPGHFPDDAHGLAMFDGTHLYEHADPRQGRHMDWGTLIYNFGRAEVCNFLIANALFWLEDFHIDGLRVDAVASMLYLNYSRKDGQWIPNAFGGHENLEAIAFLKRLNEVVYEEHPGAFTVAEESTAWPMVSRPTYLGGLGFGFKWNMGWMHDTLRYISKDPVHRAYHHNDLTFGLLYAYHENFVLPLSHDEVVHGKGSLIGRMPGDHWQKFANLRAYFAFMWTHPGKKLLFMGGEFAQLSEWDHDKSLDWHLDTDPLHAGVRAVVRDLNALYRRTPALFTADFEPAGFAWIDSCNPEQSVLAYLRRDPKSGAVAVVVINFTPVVRETYRVGVPAPGFYVEAINTDSALYGGGNVGNGGGVAAAATPAHGQPCSVVVTLPPLAALILTPGSADGS
ncbi:1,4-alpha-glucan branching protein GlgB [Oleispirillum naphthae]|uniref:1,4-alpha-glucan branching protein GlgB n=1 Tax=Oleispirillum naphthae TaxID=2838853 RepID=UPI0030822DB5